MSTTLSLMASKSAALSKDWLTYKFLFENAKTLLFIYVLLTQSLKAERHLWARGLIPSIREFYTWISQVWKEPLEFIHTPT